MDEKKEIMKDIELQLRRIADAFAWFKKDTEKRDAEQKAKEDLWPKSHTELMRESLRNLRIRGAVEIYKQNVSTTLTDVLSNKMQPGTALQHLREYEDKIIEMVGVDEEGSRGEEPETEE